MKTFKIIKVIAKLAFSMAIGAGGMYLLMKKRFEKELEKATASEREMFHSIVREMRQTFEKELNEKKTNNPEKEKSKAETVSANGKRRNDPVDPEMASKYCEMHGIDENLSFHKLLVEAKYDPKKALKVTNTEPFVIPEEEFNKVPALMLCFLTYFRESGNLIDSVYNEDYYDDVLKLIGSEGCKALQRPGQYAVYIRNFKYNLDICINVLDKEYIDEEYA